MLNTTLKNIVPVMTSNSQDGWVASASSKYSNDYDYYKACDGNIATWWASLDVEGYLQLQSPIQKAIYKYSILINGFALEYSPRDWTLQYSDNGTDWTIIDTQVDKG